MRDTERDVSGTDYSSPVMGQNQNLRVSQAVSSSEMGMSRRDQTLDTLMTCMHMSRYRRFITRVFTPNLVNGS